MRNLELITLIDLPAVANDFDTEWWGKISEDPVEVTRIKMLSSAINGLVPQKIPSQFVPANALSDEQWEAIIRVHVVDVNIDESCAIFGGYGLRVDGSWWLMPQCCSTLADIHSWNKVRSIIDDSNAEGTVSEHVFLSEGHPSPRIYREQNEIVFDCIDSEEVFFPETQKHFRLKCSELAVAIDTLSLEINCIEKTLDNLAPVFQVKSLSHLIY